MTLAPYIHAMGRGPSRARSLTEAEAADAMTVMLNGTAAPEAIGALLMLMRYRGETADEVAGFTRAARTHMTAWHEIGAALDWPAYAAGRSRGLPWFLLSARLVARAGYPVLLHGWNSYQSNAADVQAALGPVGIPVAETASAARTALASGGIAYVPLETLCPALLNLLRLRDVLGLRSCVNTVCRMLNPGAAAAMVQGVFHPSYRALQQDAGALLGQESLMVLKGGGGEFERHPGKAISLYGLSQGQPFTTTAPPLLDAQRRLADPDASRVHLAAVWTGAATDAWGESIVIGTAAAALTALDPALDLATAEDRARALWHTRSLPQAA